jgi:hypothetical protein
LKLFSDNDNSVKVYGIDFSTSVRRSNEKLIPHSRVPKRIEDLIDYLECKKTWISNYHERHEERLGIACTRVEKMERPSRFEQVQI